MGKIKGGIKGKVSGKVGKMVFVDSGGKQFVRQAPTPPKTRTELQLGNQDFFKYKQEWINRIKEVILPGFKNNIPYMGGTAYAQQYLSANAVTGKGAEGQIHPERMLISFGELPGAENASVELESKEAVFSWDANISRSNSPHDSVLAVAYNVNELVPYYITRGYFRNQEQLRLPIEKPGEYHCYLGFVAEDRSRQSNSHYLGTINVE